MHETPTDAPLLDLKFGVTTKLPWATWHPAQFCILLCLDDTAHMVHPEKKKDMFQSMYRESVRR